MLELKLHSNISRTILATVLLFIITLSAFGVSLKSRDLEFDVFQMSGDSGSAVHLLRAKNWYQEGPVALKFGLYNEIKTIENENVFTRENIYSSYLPGQIIPTYLIAKLFNHEPNVAILVKLNLFIHFCAAFLLSLVIFFFLRQIKFKLLYAFLFSLIPIFLELFLPGPFTLHHEFLTDAHIAILPFVLFLFLEVILDSIKKEKYQKIVKLIQGLILFYGILVSWFFIVVALVTYLKRLYLKQSQPFLKKSIYFWLPLIIGLVLYFIQQIILLNGLKAFQKMQEMFTIKSGFSSAANQLGLLSSFFRHYNDLYGPVGFWLLLLTALIVLVVIIYTLVKYYNHKITVNEKTKKTLTLILIIILPALLYCFLFRQQVSNHSFEFLKFSPFAATIPFILMPVLIYNLFNKKFTKKVEVLLIASIIILSFVYVGTASLAERTLFPKTASIEQAATKFISANTKYEDIVFTTINELPGSHLGAYDYTLLAQTNKKIYKIYSPKDIYKKIQDFEQEYVINILLLKNSQQEPSIQKLIDQVNHELIENEYFYLYKIQKKDFLALDKTIFGDLEELVNNGDFDSATHNWSLMPNVVLSNEAGYRGKALKIELTAAATKGIYQAVTVIKGQEYSFTFYHKNGSGNISYYLSSTLNGQEIKPAEDISASYWKENSYNFKATSDIVYIQFDVRSTGEIGDYAFLDEVSLKENLSP